MAQEFKEFEKQRIRELQDSSTWKIVLRVQQFCYLYREAKVTECKTPLYVHIGSLCQNRKFNLFPESETPVSLRRPALFPIYAFPLSPEIWIYFSG